MFANNNYAKVWKIYPPQKKDQKFTLVQMSTSQKDKKSGEYNTDFSGYVRLISKAFEKSKELEAKDSIKIVKCGVTTSYNKQENKSYETFLIFDFDFANDKKEKEAEKGVDEFMSMDDIENVKLPFED